MKIIIIILHLANGEVAKIPTQLAIGEFCSDKVEEYTKFVENKNYKVGKSEMEGAKNVGKSESRKVGKSDTQKSRKVGKSEGRKK